MRINRQAIIVLLLLCASCGSDDKQGDHVWKEQTDTIDRAKDVESMLMKSAEDKARKIDDGTN